MTTEEEYKRQQIKNKLIKEFKIITYNKFIDSYPIIKNAV